jgi:hypothetical protein
MSISGILSFTFSAILKCASHVANLSTHLHLFLLKY